MSLMREIGRAVAAVEQRTAEPTIDAPGEREPAAALAELRERVQADPTLLDALLQRIVEMHAVRTHLRWIRAAIGRDVALIDVRSALYFQARRQGHARRHRRV